MIGIRLLISIACILGFVNVAQAAPITYAFSGTLDQPIEGASTFSGSLSFDNGTPGLSPFYLIEGQSGATASLQIGSDTFEFRNSMTQPGNVELQFVHEGSDSFSLTAINGVPSSNSLGASASMWIQFSGAHVFPSDGYLLPTLDLKDFPSSQFRVSVSSQSGLSTTGTLTSFQLPGAPPTPTPEPTALALFSVLAIGLILRHGLRGVT